MLQDKDRIFTNLYGLHSPGLEAAQKRGAWHLTREMLATGSAIRSRRADCVVGAVLAFRRA